MSPFYRALATIGGLLLLLGLVSTPLKGRLPLSEPLIALLAGVALGPHGLGLLDLSAWGPPEPILEQASRVTLAVALMGTALRLPAGYLRRHWRPLAILLGPLLLGMWLAGSLLVYAILRPPVLVALLIGAVLTPTDPVIAGSIVTGALAERAVPARLRHLLSAASGANDGLGYPFVMLPLLLVSHPLRQAWLHWLTYTLPWEVGLAVLVGALLGAAAGRLLQWARAARTAAGPSLLGVTLALSLTVLGSVKVLGSDSILAVFAAGLAFNAVARDDAAAQRERVQDAVARFFTLPVFVLLGLAIPWGGWLALGWGGVLLIAAVLTLRRLPALLALRPVLGPVRDLPDALFLGWFGPIGISALYYAALGLRETRMELVWAVGSLLVCASVVAFGVTATPLTAWYGRHEERRQPAPGDARSATRAASR